MPAVTPSFLFDLESRMRVIQENDYNRLLDDLWWTQVTRPMTSTALREIVTWLLSTAQIEYKGERGGNIHFEDIVSQLHEYKHEHAGTGLKLHRDQLEDTDGNGLALASQWASDVGFQSAYWPQKQTALALKNGEAATSLAYDGKKFFATDHPLNPFNTGAGNYSNLLVGANYRIDVGVDAETALENLTNVFAHIRSIKMPNGVDPRYLRPVGLLCGPKLGARAVQLSNAKFIAQTAGSGAGAGDVEALVKMLSFATPILADELAGFESDTSYFVIATPAASSQLGGLIYSVRRPFEVTYYTGNNAAGSTGVDAILDRSEMFEWHLKGRNTLAYGHPYAIFKIKAS